MDSISGEHFIMLGRMATFSGKEEDIEAGKQSKAPALVSTFCQWLAFHSESRRGKSAHQLLKRKQGESVF